MSGKTTSTAQNPPVEKPPVEDKLIDQSVSDEEAEQEAEFDPFDGAGTCVHGENADDCGLCE
jgi:hypothetical protein